MQHLKEALEALDQIISDLEVKVEADEIARRAEAKKQNDLVKASRAREASVIAVAQKIATRLDDTIGRVEHVLRT